MADDLNPQQVPDEDVGTRIHFDETQQKFHVERRQDVEPVLNELARLRQVTDGKSKTGELYHAARFPVVLVEKYCNDHHITFAEFMRNKAHVRAMLQDPSLAYFRIWQGKV